MTMQLTCFLQSTQTELSEKSEEATNVQSKPYSLTEIKETLQQATTIDKIDLVDISSSDIAKITIRKILMFLNQRTISLQVQMSPALILIEI